MKPVSFVCGGRVSRPATEICDSIADVQNWPLFTGYGPLPGIVSARYEIKNDNMMGSRIRVQNTDGSTHIEEVLRWVPGKEVDLRLMEFTPPLKYLATHFIERWRFDERPDGTHVTRSFEMYATRSLWKPFLWLMSLLLRRAISRHMKVIA